MSILVYTPDELPAEDRYAVEEMGYDPTKYKFIATAMYEHGHDMLEELFGSAHIVTFNPDEDENPIEHYALIGLK